MKSQRLIWTFAIGLVCGTALSVPSIIQTEPAFAQSTHGSGKGSGHSGSSGSSQSHDEAGESGHTSEASGKKKKGQGGASGGGHSLRDVFKTLEDEASMADDEGHATDKGKKGVGEKGKDTKGKASSAGKAQKGKKGGGEDEPSVGEEEDSDRPEWAGTPGRDGKPGRGNSTPGTKRGTLFGDMYVILRDENGVPILTQLADGTWVVQPIDAAGNVIPLDAEGAPIDETLVQEVELGRLNVGRSPQGVLSTRYEEVLNAINAADSVTIDAAGRLTLVTNDDPATPDVNEATTKTIDAPLENLALYVEILNTGTITGVDSDTVFSAELQNLIDGQYTAADLIEAASFLAGAADKTGELSTDAVVYMNSILGIDGTLADSQGDGEYVDYSTFSYDRSDTYGDATTTVLVYVADPDGDGPLTDSWVSKEVNIYEAVFGSTDYSSASGVDGFAQAADDALQVIEYVHEYEVPIVPTTTSTN
jgi:hypothetical protein